MKIKDNAAAVDPCPIDYAFQRVGGKYKARILWNIDQNEVLRYGELKRIIYGVTPKMLTQTLRELENDNLINRRVYNEVPAKVEYTLTETGRSLIPFIGHLLTWALSQMATTNGKAVREPLTPSSKTENIKYAKSLLKNYVI